MSTTKIILDYPVTVDGQTISELYMRRPKVADKIAVANLATGIAEVTLLANLTEQSPALIRELDYSDYIRLEEAYLDFLPEKYRLQNSD